MLTVKRTSKLHIQNARIIDLIILEVVGIGESHLSSSVQPTADFLGDKIRGAMHQFLRIILNSDAWRDF
jgi:hypothetical protein